MPPGPRRAVLHIQTGASTPPDSRCAPRPREGIPATSAPLVTPLAVLALLAACALQVAREVDPPRRLRFAGHAWRVKASHGERTGPGPNEWSDDRSNAWVDRAGLHLRITSRGGAWRCPEVWSEERFGHGRLRFTVRGPLRALDRNVVAAGFLYGDPDPELDFEFGRWGAATGPDAQFAVQPAERVGRLHRFALAAPALETTHELEWWPDSARFVTRGAAPPPMASWTWRGRVPGPARAAVHFDLWLVAGEAPSDGREVEIVIADFAWAPHAAGPPAQSGPRDPDPDGVRPISPVAPSPARAPAPRRCPRRGRRAR